MKKRILVPALIFACSLFFTNAYAQTYDLFIGGGLITGKAGAENRIKVKGHEVLAHDDDVSGSGGSLCIGTINDTYMAMFEVSIMDFDDARISNFLVAGNYFIGGTERFKPYLGLHAGYASFTWTEDLVMNDGSRFDLEDETTGSIAIGGRAGLVMHLTDSFFLDCGYKYTMTSLETDLEFSSDIKGEIESPNNHGAYLTVNYCF